MKAIIYGVGASLFFAVTFILNRQMSLSGGNWIWSAALRYLFMLPILLIFMMLRRELKAVLREIKYNLVSWFLWSFVGFGVFYVPLTFASTYTPSWLVAGTWQFTIVAGVLLSPLFYKVIDTGKGISKIRNKIPLKALFLSTIILIGIILMQANEVKRVAFIEIFAGVLPVIIAAFAYPLGNRKMMELCKDRLNTFQRVFGMTLCSMPLWIIMAIVAYEASGVPSKGQLLQSLIVALSSGVVATILFFKATDMAKSNSHQLAAVEATQAGEVIFTLLGEVVIFKEKIPTTVALIGMVIVIVGMVCHSLSSGKKEISKDVSTNL